MRLTGMLRQRPWSYLKHFVLVIILTFATACTTLGPNFEKPRAPVSKAWIEQGNAKVKTVKDADYKDWWKVFDDPVLNSLIQTAYKQNLDLQIAGTRILQARATLGIVVGEQYPQLQDVTGAYSYNRVSKNAANTGAGDLNFQDYIYGLDAAWEIDFWGRFRRAVESADASLIASIADYDAVLVTLTADVAATYTLIRIFQERLAVARENVDIQGKSFDLTDILYKNGAVTDLDVQQSKSLLRDTEATIPFLETGLRQSENALCVLLGIPPKNLNEMLTGPKIIPEAPSEVVIGIPAELLTRRPDIRRAELQAAAQSAQIGVARAELFPRISLVGFFGFESSDSSVTRTGGSDFGDLFSWNSFTMSTGPTISWPIWNYGRLTNNVRLQDARFQQLLINYQNTVLRAAREVEDALIGFLLAQDQVALLQESVSAAKRAADLSYLQYQEGATDYTRVLNSQQFLLSAQDRLTLAKGSVPTNLIALYRSLGGGWKMRLGKDFVSAKNINMMKSRTNWGDLLPPRNLPANLQPPPPANVHELPRKPDW